MNADIKIVDGKVVYGLEDCFCDEAGTVSGTKDCPTCKGTGRTKAGLGKGACRVCYGFKTTVDITKRIVCTRCNGTHKLQSNRCSYMADEIFQSLRFVVYRSDRPQSITESLYGVGVFSCTDYGRHTEMTDEALIEHVKSHGSVQATKICKEDDTVCTHVGIFCNRNGYTVQAVY